MTIAATTTAPEALPAVRASLREMVVSSVRVELTSFFRVKDQVVFTFIFPVLLLVIFATVFGDEAAGPVPFVQYFLPGMVASGLLLVTFQNLAITIAMERTDGTLKRLAGTPMPPAVYFAGKVGVVLVIGLAQQLVLLFVAATVYGVPLPTAPGRWLTFAWVALLGVTAGTLAGVAFSSVPRTGKSASAVVTPVVLVLQFASGVFFAIEDIPPWLRRVAELFPLKWVAQGMRSVFLPDSYVIREPAGSWQHPTMAAVLVVWCVLGLVLCARTFRWVGRDDG
jgi:ABC-2 type transport system permease protein